MTDLTMDTGLDHEQRRYLQMVTESIQALLTLLNDILDFSKIETGHPDLEEQWSPFSDGAEAKGSFASVYR